MTAALSSLPFAGLRVLDISQGIAGPYCAHVLWQQGADVIKVEPPSGDWARGVGVLLDGTSSLLVAFNGGKRGVCVDAHRPEGRAILQRLAADADVVVENFRPGVAARLGLDVVQLRARRPELIFVSISGYGDSGPYAGLPATDSVVQADAGLMFCNRGNDATPRKIGVYLADVNSGLYGAQAVSAALYRRARTGEGAHIELNLFDTCAATLVCNFAEYAMAPERERQPVIPVSAPNGTWKTGDGSINIVTLNDAQFAQVCTALERPEWLQDPRFANGADRVTNVHALNRLVGEVLATRPTAQWVALLKAHDVLCAPVRSFAECIAHPQAAHLGTFEPVQQPETGLLALPGTPVRSMRRAMAPAPKLGEHTATVLQASGFGSDELARWRAAGVLVQA
jgi:crotonobetainyl-CoA:carnitine CoA-transferase CaiB-like acyl-CoA transferase